MSKIPSGLSAREVDRHLKDAVAELRRSEQRAILWFAEILHRALYRDLGFGSIQQYAALALRFGPAKTAQFIRLARAFRELPRLRLSVARGELTWTQARTVAGVATPGTEAAWLTVAKGTSSRGLEEQVRLARQAARAAATGRGQTGLKLERVESGEWNGVGAGVRVGVGAGRGSGSSRGTGTGTGTGSDTGTGTCTRNGKGNGNGNVGGDSGGNGTGTGTRTETEREVPPLVPPVGSLPLPRRVQLRFSPEQGARYDALLEAARKQGVRGGREDLLLGALELLVTSGVCGRVERYETRSGEVDGSGRCRARTAKEPSGTPDGTPDGTPGRAPDRAPGRTPDRPPDRPPGRAPDRPPDRPPGRVFASPYQVLVQLCPSCAGGSVVTGRGAEPLHPQELQAILCDARVRRRGKRNRVGIPARVRREVLERDGHRCRAAGCGSTRFLAVHHRTPRAAGGTNDPGNLLTLCASCHRAIHGHHGQPEQPGLTETKGVGSTEGPSTRGSEPGKGATAGPGSAGAIEATQAVGVTIAAGATQAAGVTGVAGTIEATGVAGSIATPRLDRGG